MKRQMTLTTLVAIALIATGAGALAQTTPVYQATDGPSGATVRIFRTQAGIRIDLDSANVSLTKQLTANQSIVTTVRDSKESLRIEVSDAGMQVTGPRGKVTAAAGDSKAAEQARALVAESPLSSRVATLIGKMDLGSGSPITPLLLTTRAFFLTANNDTAGIRDLMAWMKARSQQQQVTRTSLPLGAQKSSTQCYNEYSDELLAAYDQFADCMNNIKWWDPFFPIQRCEVTYESRILAAFAGWMHCLGVMDPVLN